MLPTDCLATLTQAGQKAIMDVGGPDVWDTVLDDEQQARIQQAACTTLCRELGEKALEIWNSCDRDNDETDGPWKELEEKFVPVRWELLGYSFYKSGDKLVSLQL